MFIDKLNLVLSILVLLVYAVANILVAWRYSPKLMWKEFWKEQKWCGKICANVFYLPAWIINLVLMVFVCLVCWVLMPIYKLLKALIKWLYPLYKKAIKFEL